MKYSWREDVFPGLAKKVKAWIRSVF